MTESDRPRAGLAAAADEMRRLGELLMARAIDDEALGVLADELRRLRTPLDDAPAVAKADRVELRGRISHFIETGSWPPPPPDGAVLEFDPVSAIGGELNPFSMGAVYRRDGDEAVGTVTVGRCYEGPPDRVHGGFVCAIFDEVMGSVFRATGTASAFTGELTVRFEAPAPIGVELEFRARLAGTDGRKRFLEGEAAGPDGRFASARATFIEMRVDHFVAPQSAPE